MKRKFSLVHLTYMGWSPVEMIYNAALIGFDCVSPRTISQGLPGERSYDITGDNDLYKATKQALADTGLEMNDIELAKIDENTRDIGKYEPHLAAAASLGVKNVVTNIWVSDSAFYTEKFGELCDLAARYGMTVNLECVTWAKVTNLQGARKLIDAVGRPNSAVLLDTLHFHRSRVSLEEIDACPEGMFRIAHLCDAAFEIPDDEQSLIHTGRAERFYPGDGGIDIAGMAKRLGKEVVFGIEIPHAVNVGKFGPTEHVRRCFVRTREYLKKHGVE